MALRATHEDEEGGAGLTTGGDQWSALSGISLTMLLRLWSRLTGRAEFATPPSSTEVRMALAGHPTARRRCGASFSLQPPSGGSPGLWIAPAFNRAVTLTRRGLIAASLPLATAGSLRGSRPEFRAGD